MFLTVVSGEDSYLLWRVTLETQVHEQSNSILSLSQILKRWKDKLDMPSAMYSDLANLVMLGQNV